jgi:hypothetical protein
VSDINTNVRLFDLVRYCRAGLHEEGLIDDKEYAWLCAEASINKSPSGGSPSARRLEDYDQLKDRIKRLEAFVNRFLDPEDLGYAVNKCFRDDAREALGRSRVESPSKNNNL